MINLNTTDLINIGKEELIQIAKQELGEYKEVRLCNSVTNNIRQIKVLEAVEKRLQYFSMQDTEALNIRTEIKDLLNQDVYSSTTQKSRILSDYEVMQKHYNNFR